MSKFKGQAGHGIDPVDALAADIYARMVATGQSSQYTLKQLEFKAREAAESFYNRNDLIPNEEIKK